MMKRFSILIFNLIIIFAMSCEGTEFSVKCSDCTKDEPYVTMLKCKIIPDSYEGTLVQIWEGKLEDSILVASKRVFGLTFETAVALNRYYTITATYIVDNKTYVAVNSATPKVGRADNKCDEACYFVYGNEVNLRLKYK